MRKARCSQRNLFEKAAPLTELQPELRSKLAPLLQALFAEAAGVRQGQIELTDCSSREDGDDQDNG